MTLADTPHRTKARKYRRPHLATRPARPTRPAHPTAKPNLRVVSGGLDTDADSRPTLTIITCPPTVRPHAFWTDWAPMIFLGLSLLAAAPLALIEALSR